MSITFRILGAAGRDNALLVQVESGQASERLLFDCGEGCLAELPFAELLGIDQLFFSHLHMDHVAGFDTFFRAHFNRNTKPNQIWGPPETARILQHRFQGYLWNLHGDMSATWIVSDIYPNEIRAMRYELNEAFAVAHDGGTRRYEGIVLEGEGYTVEAITMDHRTPTLAYIIREKPRRNVAMDRLAGLGLRPGPWLKQLKEAVSGDITIDGVVRNGDELRRSLLRETPGDAIAYLTDFLLDDRTMDRLAAALVGCGTIVCEGQYRQADWELAQKHFHMTTVRSATLAQRAGVKELVLFHLSDRYRPEQWREMLQEAREIFPNTQYPLQWEF